MPNVLTITCDASKMESQLAQAENRVKAAKTAMQSGGAGQFDAGGTAQAMTNAGNAAKTAGGQFAAASNAVSALGAAAGVNIPPIGSFGSLIKSLASPVGLVTGLVVALAAVIVQRLQMAMRAQLDLAEDNLKNVKENAAAHEKLREKTNQYLNTLQQLASKEAMSNAEKVKAIQTVRALTAAYGDLGIKVNSATGQITGLDAAMAKKLKDDRDQEIRDLENEREALVASGAAWREHSNSLFVSDEARNNATDKANAAAARVAEIDRKLRALRRSDPVRDYTERRGAEINDLAEKNAERENAWYDEFMRSSPFVKKTDRVDYLREQFEDWGNKLRELQSLLEEEYDPEKHGSELEFSSRRNKLHSEFIDARAKFMGYSNSLLDLLKPNMPGLTGGVLTNSLTARGGFQSGRVNLEERYRTFSYIKEIASNTSRYLDVQQRVFDVLGTE